MTFFICCLFVAVVFCCCHCFYIFLTSHDPTLQILINGDTAFKSPVSFFDSQPKINAFIMVTMCMGSVFVWGLSMMWYKRITMGLLKALGLVGGVKESVE